MFSLKLSISQGQLLIRVQQSFKYPLTVLATVLSRKSLRRTVKSTRNGSTLVLGTLTDPYWLVARSSCLSFSFGCVTLPWCSDTHPLSLFSSWVP